MLRSDGPTSPARDRLLHAVRESLPDRSYRGRALRGAVEVEVNADGRIVDVVLDASSVPRVQMAELGAAVAAAHGEARFLAAQAASQAWQQALDSGAGAAG